MRRVTITPGSLGTDCWVCSFTGPNGYAAVGIEGDNFLAHRVAYEHIKGPIPDGLQIDHLCRVRRCVNPDHLEAVTQRVNILRGESLGAIVTRTGICIHGHSLADAYVKSRGGRTCRTCNTLSNLKRDRRKKKAA